MKISIFTGGSRVIRTCHRNPKQALKVVQTIKVAGGYVV